jgi:hypothetical protein
MQGIMSDLSEQLVEAAVNGVIEEFGGRWPDGPRMTANDEVLRRIVRAATVAVLRELSGHGVLKIDWAWVNGLADEIERQR